MTGTGRGGNRALTGLVIEIVLVSVLGYIFVGREVFVPRHPMFTFLVLSLTLIGAFNVILYRGRKEFSYLVLCVTTLLAVTWFWNRSFAITFRGLGRFWVIAAVSALAARLVGTALARAFRFGGTIVWLVLGIVFYILMIGMDLLLFGIYPSDEVSRWTSYLLNALLLGAVLGAGLGVGYDVARYLSPDMPAAPGDTDSPPPTTSA